MAEHASPPVRERPILMSGRMVRAILAGRKSVTRRVVKPQPPEGADGVARIAVMPPLPDGTCEELWWKREEPYHPMLARIPRCPYGVPGEKLWVRETWTAIRSSLADHDRRGVLYRADPMYDGMGAFDWTWRPSIYMPRWASRILLEVTEVRVERVQDISEAEAAAEGIPEHVVEHTFRKVYRDADERAAKRVEYFAGTWDSLNAARGYGWDANPWVWVIRFRRVEAAS